MKPPFKITNKIIDLIASITKELGRIEGQQFHVLGPKLRRQNKIKTIQATLAIEGNTLTLDQMTAVLEGRKVLGPKKEIVEVQNAIALYEELLSFKPFSLKDFLKAHKKLMASLVNSEGQFRDSNVGILKGSKVSHLAPRPRLVPELMNNLFIWARKEQDLHPLIKSCVLHYEIEFIHPFEDGNGRMGRFWQSVVLSKYNPLFCYLPIESLIKDNQKKYYSVLEKCDKAGHCTFFIEFMLELILSATQEFSNNIKSITPDSTQRLARASSFFKGNFFSRKDYMILFKNISSATASRDLKEGMSKKFLDKSGVGNQTRYQFKMVLPTGVG